MDDTSWYLVEGDGTCIEYEQTLSLLLPNDTSSTTTTNPLILETMLLVEPITEPIAKPMEPPKQSFYHSHRVIENGHHYFLDPAHESDGDLEQQTDEAATHAIEKDEHVERLKKRGQHKKRKCYTNRPHRTKILSPQQQSKHDQRLQQRVKREVNYLLKTAQKR
jgi:hypothetical protein